MSTQAVDRRPGWLTFAAIPRRALASHGSPRPRSGAITDPLGRDPGDRRRVIVMPGGAASETRYDVIRSLPGDFSLVRCELMTGRTPFQSVRLMYTDFASGISTNRT